MLRFAARGHSHAGAYVVSIMPALVVLFWAEICLITVYMVKFLLYRCAKVEPRGLLILRRQSEQVALISLFGYISNLIILRAFNFGGDVAAFVSNHQTLIPISALIDGLWLCESHSPFRPTASLMFVGGIVMIIANG